MARYARLVVQQKQHHPPKICRVRRGLIAKYCPTLLANSTATPQILGP
jgi:hypothetical protein